jgi:hypothetical protein
MIRIKKINIKLLIFLQRLFISKEQSKKISTIFKKFKNYDRPACLYSSPAFSLTLRIQVERERPQNSSARRGRAVFCNNR